MMGTRMPVALSVFLALFLAPLEAAIKTYSDRAVFLQETGARDVTNPLATFGTVNGPRDLGTLEPLVVSAPAWFSDDWSSRLPGPEVLISSGVTPSSSESVDVELAGNANAFGFDFVEPETDPNVNAPFVDSVFRVILLRDDTRVEQFTFNAPNDQAVFVGVWSEKTFNRVQIREIAGSNENEFYGHFYTGYTEPLNLSRLKPRQLDKEIASNPGFNDQFGFAIDMDGDTLVVGAPTENGDNETGPDSGVVYVFERQGNDWVEQAKLRAGDARNGDMFGHAVAIDGDTVVVGAFQEDAVDLSGDDTGAAYVFVRANGSWSQQQKLRGDVSGGDDEFGSSVAIDGDTILVGAPRDSDNGPLEGSAFVFVRENGSWSQQARIAPGTGGGADQFGAAVALDGDTAVFGAVGQDVTIGNTGAAYVYTRSGSNWTLQQRLSAADPRQSARAGNAVAIQGNRVVMGAVFDREGGAEGSGAVYVFFRDGNNWVQEAKIIPVEPSFNFGRSVALEGASLLIGAPLTDTRGEDAGAAFLYQRQGSHWVPQATLFAADARAGAHFGYSAAISGDIAAIGARWDAHSGEDLAGSSYVFSGMDPLADSDGDGVSNQQDHLPHNPNESVDTDGDGTGDNTDNDDDGDGMPDAYENSNGFDSLDPADAARDADGDGATNRREFRSGTDPRDPNSRPQVDPAPTLHLLLD